ncbi:MAG: CoB--CoM heterodisulfide reductase iron-sulfur subunit B family protein [Methanotrichaceae archaeon]|nr:CoB--CoM heterodisulfide reductase iron-sulfur subunit B family protein [Methanotrichaceae archaeon]
MRLAYYPGCVSKSSGREMDISTKAVCSALGITLEELEDWNCCGATHVSNELTAVGLAVRNISQTDLPIMTSCSICYSNLRSALQRMDDPNIKSRVNDILGKEHEGAKIRHALDVILEVLQKKNSDFLVVSLKDLKVAPYYGCLMTRPKGVDSPEFPTIMEKLIKILNATPMEFRLKTFCCGGPIFMPQQEVAEDLAFMILSEAKNTEAEIIVTLCPLCHFMLDAKQKTLEIKRGDNIGLPVLYITQLVGIALGLGPMELGLELNSVSPFDIVERIYERHTKG